MFENDRENVFGTLQSNFLELFVLLAPDSHKNREVMVDYNVWKSQRKFDLNPV